MNICGDMIRDSRYHNAIKVIKNSGVWVEKQTRDGASTNIPWAASDLGHMIAVVVPYHSIIEDLQKQLSFIGSIAFRSNAHDCLETIKTDLSVKTRGNLCMLSSGKWLCERNCEYKTNINKIIDAEISIVFMTYDKFKAMISDNNVKEILEIYIDIWFFDEVMYLEKMKSQSMLIKDIRFTGIKSVDKVVSTAMNPCSNIVEVKPYNVSKIYKKYERSKDPQEEIAQIILFFGASKFEKHGQYLSSHKDMSKIHKFMKKVKNKSVFTDATWNIKKLRKIVGKLRKYKWRSGIVRNKHFLIVDETVINSSQVLKRYRALHTNGFDPLTVFPNKKTFYKYNSHQPIKSTYYRGPLTVGVKVDTNCMLLVGLPHKPKKELEKDEDYDEFIRGEFSQSVDRIKDGNNKKYSFAFVIGVDYPDVLKYYRGEAKIVRIGRGVLTSNVKTYVDVLKDNEVDRRDISSVARLIDGKANPSKTAERMVGKPHIEYKDYIRKKRKIKRDTQAFMAKLKKGGRNNDR